MKAVVMEKPGVMAVKDVEIPGIKKDEVLLKVITSSICNATDNHIYHGIFDGSHDFYPQILGHEVFGEVVEIGSEVKGVKLGDRLVSYVSGGAFCEYTKLKPESALFGKVPSTIPAREASLCEMFDGSYVKVVYPADIKDTEDVLVIGQGPMGLTVTALAALKARSVTAVDMHSLRLKKSMELGSQYTYNRSEMRSDEILAQIEKNTGGVDVVFMCIAEDQSKELDAFNLGAKALRKNGRMTGLIVDVKNIGDNHRLDPHLILSKEIKFCHTLEDVYPDERAKQKVFQQGVDMVGEGLVKLGVMITHEITLDEMEYALNLCQNRQNEVIKVVVHPEIRGR